MKAKQLNRALHDLAEEGVVQVFQPLLGSRTILGVVGALQFDVLQSRLQQEYGVPVRYEPAPSWPRAGCGREHARWRTFVERNRWTWRPIATVRLCTCPRASGCCGRRWKIFRTWSS